MVLPTVFLIHAVTVQTRIQKQKLLYDGGTVAFTVGRTVKGSTSNATGAIDKVTGTVATGILVFTVVTGVFQNDEPIAEIAPGTGAAVANGTLSNYTNSYNQPEYYFTSAASTINVRLSTVSGSESGVQITEGGELVLPRVTALVPSTSVLTPAVNRISTTVTGYTGTYEVESVQPTYEPATVVVSHYKAILKKVPT